MGRHDTAEFNLIYCTSMLCITALAPAACVSSNTIWKRCSHQVNAACSDSGEKNIFILTHRAVSLTCLAASRCVSERNICLLLNKFKLVGTLLVILKRDVFSLCIAKMESCVYTVIGACKLSKIA